MVAKPWWEIAVPHRDIREGRVSDFAAGLNSIVKGEATVEYRDPVTFLKRTHLTKGLEDIAKDVLSVFSGEVEEQDHTGSNTVRRRKNSRINLLVPSHKGLRSPLCLLRSS